MRIVIVGAGVAGCVMARTLSRLPGVELICLERVQRDDHSEAGTGLNVGPNAVKALTSVDPELAHDITRASYVWRNWRISLTDGTVLFDLPLADVTATDFQHDVCRNQLVSLPAFGCEVYHQLPTDPVVHGSARTSPTFGEFGNREKLLDSAGRRRR